MSELTEFILARIAEDEAVARGTTEGWGSDCPGCNGTSSGLVDGFDPARVLAECAALREVVRITRGLGGYYNPDAAREAPGILRALATIWSDHPTYRPEEWA